jgi:uncharacterized protein
MSSLPSVRFDSSVTAMEFAFVLAMGLVAGTLSGIVGFGSSMMLGVPGAALGACTLLVLPTAAVEAALGVFFILMIPIRRWLARRQFKFTLWHLAIIGAVVGYLTGIVVSTGPITVPVFLSYGLVKGAFLATEAAGSLAVYVSKVIVFRQFGALPMDIIVKGLITGASLMAGAFIAKRVVVKLDAERFRLLMDALLGVSGGAMLWTAATGP